MDGIGEGTIQERFANKPQAYMDHEPSMKERLEEKKAKLELQLKVVNESLDAIAKYPEAYNLFDTIRKGLSV